MAAKQLELTAQAVDAAKRLDHFLQEKLPQYSRARIQGWIRTGHVRVNGNAAAKPSTLLRGAERLEIFPQDLPPLRAYPEDLPLPVLYLDDDVIVVDKPAGMQVHAGAGRHAGTVVNALLYRFQTLSGIGGEERPGIVHRLDRETSGVLVAARHDVAHRKLADQFAARTVEKEYVALVHGSPPDGGRVMTPITRDPIRRTRMTTRLAHGRAALTEYHVERRFTGFSLLGVRIHTGRTHQIRVHLASIGYPVAGDRLYGAAAAGRGRFFLHARRLTFRSPGSGASITVEAPLPAELREWLETLDPATERAAPGS